MASTLTTILTTLFTGLIIISITAMVNIKIKYAKSEDHANRSVALIFWRIIYGCSLVFVALVLYKNLSSQEPLTRSSLVNILLASFALFSTVISYIFFRILRILDKNLSMFEIGGYVDNKLIHMIMDLPCQPPEIRKLKKPECSFKVPTD